MRFSGCRRIVQLLLFSNYSEGNFMYRTWKSVQALKVQQVSAPGACTVHVNVCAKVLSDTHPTVIWQGVAVLCVCSIQNLVRCSAVCGWSLWLITVFRACKGFCELSLQNGLCQLSAFCFCHLPNFYLTFYFFKVLFLPSNVFLFLSRYSHCLLCFFFFYVTVL